MRRHRSATARRRVRPRALACAAVALLAAGRAGAADGDAARDPTVSLRLEGGAGRDDAPWWLVGEIARSGAGLASGRLELDLFDGLTRICRVEGPEMTLGPGARPLRLLLPPGALGRSALGMVRQRVRARWRDAGGGLRDAGEFDVTTPWPGRRPLLVCAPQLAGVALDPRRGDILARLELERPARGAGERPFPVPAPTVTAIAAPDAAALPSAALGYSAWDVLCLDGAALAAIDDETLDAMALWVEAGGSAAIVGGSGVRSRDVERINALVARGGAPVVALGPLGRLEVAGAAGPLHAFECELGRLLIVESAAAAELPAAAWSGAAAFLWKVQAPAAAAPRPFGRSGRSARDWSDGSDLVPPQQAVETFLLSSLDRLGVRLLPTWAVLAVFAAFVAVLAGERVWRRLGWRGTRLPWPLLPAIAAAFALLLVGLTRWRLGGADVATRLVVVDVGASGRVLRENVFVAEFGAAGGVRERATIGAIDAPVAIDAARRRSRGPGISFDAADAADAGDNDAAATISGTPPARTIVREPVEPWSVRAHREMRIGEAATPLDLDPERIPWSRIDAICRDPVGARGAVERCRAAIAPFLQDVDDASVWLFSGADSPSAAPPSVIGDRGLEAALTVFRAGPERELDAFGRVLAPVPRAPAGGPRADDLPLIDALDEGSRAIVVRFRSRRDGATTFIYRRRVPAPRADQRGGAGREGAR